MCVIMTKIRAIWGHQASHDYWGWQNCSPPCIGVARNLCCGRDNRDAEGVEGEEYGEAVFPPQPITGSVTPAGSEAEPRPKNEFWSRPYLELEKTHLIATNLSLTFLQHIFSQIHIHNY